MSKIIYQCFSYGQKEFLLEKGHHVLCSGLHCESPHKKFWVFPITKKLQENLIEWSNNNPKNK